MFRTSHWRLIAGLVVILALIIVVHSLLPQLIALPQIWRELKDASYSLFGLALICSFVPLFFAAWMYRQLSFKRLSYNDTLLVQAAGLFVNRLLPAGIGGLGLNYAYLRGRRHTAAQAGAVVIINNLIGLLGHALLVLILIITSYHQLASLNLPVISWQVLLTIISVTIMVSLILLLLGRYFGWAGQISLALRKLGVALGHYRNRQPRLIKALFLSICLTLANVLCFWVSILAAHGSVSFLAAFIIFSFGIIAIVITPVPGGIGGAEAALFTGLLAFKVPSSTAAVSVLLYRTITVWLGIIFGFIAFLFLRWKAVIPVQKLISHR